MVREASGVRAASPHDAQVVEELFDRLSSVVAGWRGGAELLSRSRASIDGALSGALDRSLLLAFDDGELIGAAMLSYTDSGDGVFGSLELWCLPRRPGAAVLARQLLIQAESLARARGEIPLEVFALPGDRLIKSLLEEAGYLAHLIAMRKPTVNRLSRTRSGERPSG